MAESPRQLRARWRTGDGPELARTVLEGLAVGRPPTDLGLGLFQGRIDLRGIGFPDPSVGRAIEANRLVVRELGGLGRLEGLNLVGVDFSFARLQNLRIFDSAIRDSKFEGADCRDWRAWGLEITRSSFRGADLRDAVLGAWHDGRTSSYRGVDFAGANLRGLNSETADFVDCDFSGARLDGVDFGSSGFIRCRFAGDLREVIFWDRTPHAQKSVPNRMEDVDFTSANLIFVEFRRLDLDRVRLPTGPNHLIVGQYGCVLERALADLEGNETRFGRWSRGLLEHRKNWVGANQQVGIFHVEELGESPSNAAALRDLLKASEAACRSAGRPHRAEET